MWKEHLWILLAAGGEIFPWEGKGRPCKWGLGQPGWGLWGLFFVPPPAFITEAADAGSGFPSAFAAHCFGFRRQTLPLGTSSACPAKPGASGGVSLIYLMPIFFPHC